MAASSIYQAQPYPVNIDWGLKGPSLKADESNPLTIEKEGSSWETIYSLQTFNAKDYQAHAVRFTFKVEKTNMSQIVVGIINAQADQITNEWFVTKSKDIKLSPTNTTSEPDADEIALLTSTENKHKYYAVYGMFGWRNSHVTRYAYQEDWNRSKQRHYKMKSGDIVVFEVNFYERNVKFYKNKKYIGHVFNNIDCSENVNYRFALSMIHKGDRITYLHDENAKVAQTKVNSASVFQVRYKYDSSENKEEERLTSNFFNELEKVKRVKKSIIKENETGDDSHSIRVYLNDAVVKDKTTLGKAGIKLVNSGNVCITLKKGDKMTAAEMEADASPNPPVAGDAGDASESKDAQEAESKDDAAASSSAAATGGAATAASTANAGSAATTSSAASADAAESKESAPDAATGAAGAAGAVGATGATGAGPGGKASSGAGADAAAAPVLPDPKNFEWGAKGTNMGLSKFNKFTVHKVASTQGFGNWETAYSKQSFGDKRFETQSIKFELKIEKTQNSNVILSVISNTMYRDSLFASTKDDVIKRGQANEDSGKGLEKGLKYYAINGRYGTIISHKTHNEWQWDWSKNANSKQTDNSYIIKNGDTIVFELNFYQGTLQFYRNGKYIGVMFENIELQDVEYYFGVSLYTKGDAVTLVSCKPESHK